ncbi:hypothetical protein [Candidiatus Paracoxiella cheracis]|uniref:hypothetical protein n=1 Tax=Candidiatus Paracoxiella cheracis TaxID=3405120 RepID=UPI003BF4D149
MSNANTHAKYRIKSLNLKSNLLFVIEEIGKPGEFRVTAETILSHPDMLHEFAEGHVERILCAAKIEWDKNKD